MNDTPAFPRSSGPSVGDNGNDGMTMRQYYKAAALSGMGGLFSQIKSTSDVQKIFDSIQTLVPKLADAMLAEDASHDTGREDTNA